VNEFINITASYARFWPGSFTSSFAPPVQQQWPPVNLNGAPNFPGQTTTTNGLTARPTNFFYLEATANAFGEGKPIAKIPGADFVATWDKGAPEPKRPSWTDVYVGLNGGGAWSSPTLAAQVLPWSPPEIAGNAQSVADSSLNRLPARYKNNIRGFVGGFQLGANWNFAGDAVVGVEADLDGAAGNTNSQWSIGAASNRVAVTPATNPATTRTNTFTTYSQHTTTLAYLGTVRGRIGYLVTPTVQIFGSGGLAYGGVTAANAYVAYRTGGSTPGYFGPQYNGTLVGWTAGGGFEWMFTPQWSVKADYLYYNLGSVDLKDFNYSVVYAPFNPTQNYTNNNNAFGTISQTVAAFSGNVIRAGVNRHFDLATTGSVNRKD
jgi:opacity protein-like surface antigen